MQTDVWAVVFLGFGGAPATICVGPNNQLLAFKISDEHEDAQDNNDYGAKGKARSALRDFLAHWAPRAADQGLYAVRRLSLITDFDILP